MSYYRPEVFLSEDEILNRVSELAKKITSDYQGEELIVLCVLKGAIVFCTDLVKNIDLPIQLEFISLSSYGHSTMSSYNVVMDMDLTANVANKNVLIVEDIVDTGLTMKYLFNLLKEKKPKSVKLASLLHKKARTIVPVTIDYLAFEIEDKFVIGYGLDYAGRYRELPYIGVMSADN